MNLFILHTTQHINAKHHVDRHVVKMPIEATQLLCTIARERCGIDYGYRSTYVNHPVTQWVGASYDNFIWTMQYARELFYEYTYRYKREHKSQAVLEGLTPLLKQIGEQIEPRGRTPHHLAVSPELKHLEPVYAYRAYYLLHKTRLFKWTGREVPDWITDIDPEVKPYL